VGEIAEARWLSARQQAALMSGHLPFCRHVFARAKGLRSVLS